MSAPKGGTNGIGVGVVGIFGPCQTGVGGSFSKSRPRKLATQVVGFLGEIRTKNREASACAFLMLGPAAGLLVFVGEEGVDVGFCKGAAAAFLRGFFLLKLDKYTKKPEQKASFFALLASNRNHHGPRQEQRHICYFLRQCIFSPAHLAKIQVQYSKIKLFLPKKMSPKRLDITALENIGPNIASDLRAIGISDEKALREIGAEKAFELFSQTFFGQKQICPCWAYAIEGAICGQKWNEIPTARKEVFKAQAASFRASLKIGSTNKLKHCAPK